MHRVVREQKAFVVERCRACGFAQVDREPSAAELAAIYGESYFADRKYALDVAARREQARRLAFLTANGVPDGARILDVGCATGDFLLAARERFDAWGLDFSPQAIAVAHRRAPTLAERAQVGTLADAPFAAGFFDAVVLWDVIEHLWQPRPALERAAALLRPGGVLALSTPDFGAPAARWLGRRWPFLTPPEHLGFFDRSSLCRLLRSCGVQERRWTSRGKWVNVGFMFYKLRRVFPAIPEGVVRAVRQGPLGKATVYVPSGDILYIGACKPT